jgi:hypothetical protein
LCAPASEQVRNIRRSTAVRKSRRLSFGVMITDETQEAVTVDRVEFEALLAVATLYVNAFSDDEMMTIPEKLRLQEVEAILEKHGRRY